MSEALTHTRSDTGSFHPITGEPAGIKEILERRAAEEIAPPAADPPEHAAAQDDDATRAAAELSDWRRRATEAEAGRAEAVRAAHAAEQRATQATQGAEDTGFTAITTALAATQRESESLRIEMKAAGESGDFGKVADIAARLGELGAEARELERGKNEFERTRDARLRAPAPEATPAAATSATERAILGRLGAPSRDAFLASRTDATAAFLRQNMEFFTDEAAFARIRGADSLAEGRGIPRDTPAYFDLIRKEAGLSQTTTPPRQQQDSRGAPGAAPSRTPPGPSGRPPTQSGDVYVSPEQKATAEWMGVDPVEYAKEEANLRSRGELPYRRR